MLQNRLNSSILKLCQDFYQNSWFLVQKSQKEKYKLINAVMHINKIIIHNIMISSNVEQFVKKFSELKTVSLMNMQFDYDQVALAKKSCDITDFMMMLNLLRNCIFIQNEINSVVQFCRTMIQILQNLISIVCQMFLNDIAVKESQCKLTSVHKSWKLFARPCITSMLSKLIFVKR